MISLEIDVICNICMVDKENLIKCNNCVFNMCEDCFLIYVKEKKNCPHCNTIIPENLLENNEYSNIIIYPNKRQIAFLMYCSCLILFLLWCSWCIFYFKYINNFDYKSNNTTIYNNTS